MVVEFIDIDAGIDVHGCLVDAGDGGSWFFIGFVFIFDFANKFFKDVFYRKCTI